MYIQRFLWTVNYLHYMNSLFRILGCNFLLLTAVDCGSLTDPANGQVDLTSGTTFGQTATYSCNTGYNLVGDSSRTCQTTRLWSGSVPTCEGMLLKGDSTISNVYIYKKHNNMCLVLGSRRESIWKGMTA